MMQVDQKVHFYKFYYFRQQFISRGITAIKYELQPKKPFILQSVATSWLL